MSRRGKGSGGKGFGSFFFALFENIKKDLLNLKYYRCKIERDDEEISKRKKKEVKLCGGKRKPENLFSEK